MESAPTKNEYGLLKIIMSLMGESRRLVFGLQKNLESRCHNKRRRQFIVFMAEFFSKAALIRLTHGIVITNMGLVHFSLDG